jgi:hypothetical protein
MATSSVSCNVINYLKISDKALYQTIKYLDLLGLFKLKNDQQLTFLYPDKKKIELIINLTEFSNEPEKAVDIIKSLIITSYIPSISHFIKNKNITNCLNESVCIDILNSTKERAVLKNADFSITENTNFAELCKNNDNSIIYNLNGVGELPLKGVHVEKNKQPVAIKSPYINSDNIYDFVLKNFKSDTEIFEIVENDIFTILNNMQNISNSDKISLYYCIGSDSISTCINILRFMQKNHNFYTTTMYNLYTVINKKRRVYTLDNKSKHIFVKNCINVPVESIINVEKMRCKIKPYAIDLIKSKTKLKKIYENNGGNDRLANNLTMVLCALARSNNWVGENFEYKGLKFFLNFIRRKKSDDIINSYLDTASILTLCKPIIFTIGFLYNPSHDYSAYEFADAYSSIFHPHNKKIYKLLSYDDKDQFFNYKEDKENKEGKEDKEDKEDKN